VNRRGGGPIHPVVPGEARRAWAAWLVAGTAVALSSFATTALLRSWVERWDYVDPYERLPIYLAGAMLAGLGATLVYLLAWIVFPCLPPFDFDDVAASTSRLDRLWRGLRVGVACALLISIALLGAWRTLHPCDPRFGGWCGDPPVDLVPG
jgi:hypothetical protein